MPAKRSDAAKEQPGIPFRDPGPRPKYLKPKKTIRIAVAGDVLLTQLEIQMVDTPHFQRLRGIRQLGTTHLVFPTALHTRFDHSLGTLAMVTTMLRAIRDNLHSEGSQNDFTHEQEALARLYALLHDITHIPFGHTIEDELQIFTRHDKNLDRIDHFLGATSPIGGLILSHLGKDLYDRFMAIFTWDQTAPLAPHGDEFIYDLVSNTVCADLLDYLARDSYFCNLDLRLDYRFLNFLYLDNDAQGLRRTFVRLWKSTKPDPRPDTLSDLTRLMHARYLLAERVYFHHAKLVTGAMLGRALLESKTAGEIVETRDRYGEDGLYHLWDATDDSLLARLQASEATVASRLACALQKRELHKQVKEYRDEHFAAAQAAAHRSSVRSRAVTLLLDSVRRRELEDSLAAEVDAEPGDVLLYCLPEEETNFKYAAVHVLWEGRPNLLSGIDHPTARPNLDLIIAAHKRLWGVRVLVAPPLKEDSTRLSLLLEGCEIELFADDSADRERRLAYYKRLLRFRLSRQGSRIPAQANLYEEQLGKAAVELLKVARDTKAWRRRITDVLFSHFPPQ